MVEPDGVRLRRQRNLEGGTEFAAKRPVGDSRKARYVRFFAGRFDAARRSSCWALMRSFSFSTVA